MARRRRKHGRKHTGDHRPLDVGRLMNYTTYETADNGMEFTVRQISAGQKEYVCPACNGLILIGESHVVAWTEDSWFGSEAGQQARRHWHTSCWKANGRRALGW
ncbi:hypothetical protein [Trueperella bialowiezensis]|uniref:ATP/GTP-binding protein n=1 Tax=Trueperella bialowiezensis TaxID=312285 RepID=A0A3S4VU64_9ACTO|nr:hypothetical protein [Trueperella bialowiezensis]VEI13771.1 Uncharacterised protein [Trueperella bialowiezensis]